MPTPVRTHHGELLETFEHNGGDYHVALFERLDGNDLIDWMEDRWSNDRTDHGLDFSGI